MSTDPEAARQQARAMLEEARSCRARADVRRALGAAAEAYARAHEAGDWDAAFLARSIVCRMYFYRYEMPEALGWAKLAAQEAELHALAAHLGPAYQDLFCIATHLGMEEERKEWAALMGTHYGMDHPRMFAFTHDLTTYAALQSDDPRVIRDAGVQALSSTFYAKSPLDRMEFWSTRALLVARQRMTEKFRQAVDYFDAAVRDEQTGEGLAACLLDVARGAKELAWFDYAMDTAARMRAVALARHEHVLVRMADALLLEVRANAVA